MNQKIFTPWQVIVIVLTVTITSIFSFDRFKPNQDEIPRKLAIIDKEIAATTYLLSKPEITVDDRTHVINAITKVQNKYSTAGYLVLEEESCTPGQKTLILAAAPQKPVNITNELEKELSYAPQVKK